ncbi:MAG: 50S ribosomal protein L32 [Oligoflexales bacterium]|nr:50S ribosomal protein L32 [Oligoflexales bacterium]
MPVPKHRTSASKRDMRRSHHALKAPALSFCPACMEAKKPHCVCSACGQYRGRQVFTPRSKNSSADQDFQNNSSTET